MDFKPERRRSGSTNNKEKAKNLFTKRLSRLKQERDNFRRLKQEGDNLEKRKLTLTETEETIDLPNGIECTTYTLTRTERALDIIKSGRGACLATEQVKIRVISFTGGAVLVTSVNPNIDLAQASLGRSIADKRLQPMGTAANSADNQHQSVIKCLNGSKGEDGKPLLPGPHDNWGAERLVLPLDYEIIALMQLDGLRYNIGSARINWVNEEVVITDSPTAELVELLNNPDYADRLEEFGLDPVETLKYLQKDRHFICSTHAGENIILKLEYREGESYANQIERLKEMVKDKDVISGFSSHPELIIPNDNTPRHLTCDEICELGLGNDPRHVVYCPYKGFPILGAELARAITQGRSKEIGDSLYRGTRISLKLSETLAQLGQDINELKNILNEQGYAGRFEIDENSKTITIQLREQVYNHLLPCFTEKGELIVIQTSGIHGNITGQDGLTLTELVEMMKQINNKRAEGDKIIFCAFGSQGRDVNDIALNYNGLYKLLMEGKGSSTTERVGICVPITSLSLDLFD